MAIRNFSDSEMMVLKQMASDWKNRLGGNDRKPEKLTGRPSEAIGQVNDVYVARIPEGGLPGLNENEGATGSGTTLEDDQAGYVVCDMYRIAEDRSMVPLGLSRKVWNVSTNDIASSWATVHRDKFGRWLVASSAGGGSRIMFEII